jgi:hypothetical protein
VKKNTKIQDYETLSEASERLGHDSSWFRRLCLDGRIPGAIKKGSVWMIPADFVPEKQKRGPKPKQAVK